MGRSLLRHAAVITLLWAAAYGPSLWFHFVSDTFDLIANAQGLAPQGVAAFFVTPIGSFYRPLVQLSLLADLRLWGLNPVGFHLTNVVAGLLTVFLVYGLARALVPGRPRVALGAGLLFALHPLHPQAITWVAGRNDAFCALFYLLALLLIVRASAAGRIALAPALAAGGAFALALLSKEMAISFPLAAFAAVAMAPGAGPGRSRLARAAATAAALAAVAVGYAVVRAQVLGSVVGGYGAGMHLRLQPAALFYGFERPLYALIKPLHLPGSLDLWIEAPLALVALAILWAGWTPAVRTATAWMLISLLPIVSLQVGASDARLLYLPSALFCLVVALAAARLAERGGRWRPAVVAVLGAVGLIYGGALAREQVLWHQAGGLARRLVRQVGELGVDLERDRLCFAAFPHAYGPVPVFATGLASALELEYSPPRVRAVALARLVLAPGQPAHPKTLRLTHHTLAVMVDSPAWFMVWGSPDQPLAEDRGLATVTVDETRTRALIQLREPLDPAGGDRLIAYTDHGWRLISLRR